MDCCYIDNSYSNVQRFKIVVVDNSCFLDESKRMYNTKEDCALVLWMTIQNN